MSKQNKMNDKQDQYEDDQYENDHYEDYKDDDTDQIQDYMEPEKKASSFNPVYIGYAVGVIILIFGAYNILSGLFGGSDSSEKAVKAAPKPASYQFQTEASPTPKVMPTVNTASSKATHVAVAGLDELSSNLKSLEKHIQTLEKNQVELFKLVQSVKADTKYSKELEAIKDSIRQLSTDINSSDSVKAKIQDIVDKLMVHDQALNRIYAEISHVSGMLTQSKENYELISIVPGKAWIKTQEGGTIQVLPGTELPGIGKVVKIDVARQEILTSSGIIIQ